MRVELIPVTEALALFFLAMGLPIAIFKLLEMRHDFMLLFRSRPWIKNWGFHLMIFALSLLEMWWLSRGKLEKYGLGLGEVNFGWLGLSLATAIGLFLIIYLPQIVTRTPIKIDYPVTPTNVLGMMSCEWLFVGLAEELAERGVLQTYLMENLDGFIRVFRWDFHVGTILTVVLLGVTQLLLMMLLGEKPRGVLLESIYIMVFAFFIGYVYQQTNSLIGPILAHNIVRGLGITLPYILHQ